MSGGSKTEQLTCKTWYFVGHYSLNLISYNIHSFIYRTQQVTISNIVLFEAMVVLPSLIEILTQKFSHFDNPWILGIVWVSFTELKVMRYEGIRLWKVQSLMCFRLSPLCLQFLWMWFYFVLHIIPSFLHICLTWKFFAYDHRPTKHKHTSRKSTTWIYVFI